MKTEQLNEPVKLLEPFKNGPPGTLLWFKAS